MSDGFSALAMLYEVFGDGTDYDWALGDEADEQEEVVHDTKYTDVREVTLIFCFYRPFQGV